MRRVERQGIVFVQPETEADRRALEYAASVDAVDPGVEVRRSQRRTDMPMKSQKQRKFLHAKHPEIAKRFEAETPKKAKLPKVAKKKK